MGCSFPHCLLSGSESNLPPSLNEMQGHKQCAAGEKGWRGMNSLEYLLSGEAATKAELQCSHEASHLLRRILVSLSCQAFNDYYKWFHSI